MSSEVASSDTVDARALLTIPSCKLYQLDGHKRLLVETSLIVLEVSESEAYVLSIGTYTIALNASVPCLVVAPRNFVFAQTSDKDSTQYYGLVIPTSIPAEDEEVFEIILEAATALRRADSSQQRPIEEKSSSPVARVASPVAAASSSSAPVAPPLAAAVVATAVPVVASPATPVVVAAPRNSVPVALPLATAAVVAVAPATPATSPSPSNKNNNGIVVAAAVPVAVPSIPSVGPARASYPLAMAVAAPVAAPVQQVSTPSSSSSRVSYVAAVPVASAVAVAAAATPVATEAPTVVVVAAPAGVPSNDRVAAVTHHIGNGVEIGGRKLAEGIEAGGRAVGSLVRNSSKFLVSKLQPNEQPTQVSTTTRERLAKMRVVSGAAVKVSKAAALGALAAVSHLSARLSDSLGETAVARRLRDNPSERVDALKEVGRKSVGAFLTIYASLAAAGVLLLEDTKAATVEVVTHKYGLQMGQSVDNGLGVATDVGRASINMRSVGVKAIARGTAVGVASEFLSDDAERAQLRTSAPVLDPITAMSAVAAVNEASQVVSPLFASSSSSSSSSSSDGKAPATVSSSLAPLMAAAMPAILTVTTRPPPPPSVVAASAAAAAAAAQQPVVVVAAPAPSAAAGASGVANADVDVD